MNNKRFFLMTGTGILLFAACLFVGCASAPTISVSYMQPARVNMSGIKTVTITSNSPQVAQNVASSLTGHFTLVDYSAFLSWKQQNTADQKLANYQANAISVSAADLVNAYDANAARADGQYKGKTLKLTSVVQEIQVGSHGNYIVRLAGAGKDFIDVYVIKSQTNEIAALNKGQKTTVIGECNGFALPDMADTAEILRILGAGKSVNIVHARFPTEVNMTACPVDAVIQLNTSSTENDSHKTTQRTENVTDKNGKFVKDAKGHVETRTINVTTYTREVKAGVSYQIESTKDGSIIGQGNYSNSATRSSENRSNLPSGDEMAQPIINAAVHEVVGDIIPTKASMQITLAEEKDNKAAKTEMKPVADMVKQGKYADAAAAYGQIYAKYANFAAGYNQAVLTEAVSGVEPAMKLMEAVSEKASNPQDKSKAENVLAGMQSRSAADKQSAAQLAK
jgi:hypothetical protein